MIEKFSQEIIKTPGVSIVKFSSARCAPCKAYAPVFEDFAYESDVSCFECELTSDNVDFAITYGVRSLPATLVFVDGKPVNHLLGAQTKQQLTDAANEAKAKRDIDNG